MRKRAKGMKSVADSFGRKMLGGRKRDGAVCAACGQVITGSPDYHPVGKVYRVKRAFHPWCRPKEA